MADTNPRNTEFHKNHLCGNNGGSVVRLCGISFSGPCFYSINSACYIGFPSLLSMTCLGINWFAVLSLLFVKCIFGEIGVCSRLCLIIFSCWYSILCGYIWNVIMQKEYETRKSIPGLLFKS